MGPAQQRCPVSVAAAAHHCRSHGLLLVSLRALAGCTGFSVHDFGMSLGMGTRSCLLSQRLKVSLLRSRSCLVSP